MRIYKLINDFFIKRHIIDYTLSSQKDSRFGCHCRYCLFNNLELRKKVLKGDYRVHCTTAQRWTNTKSCIEFNAYLLSNLDDKIFIPKEKQK